MTTNNNPMDGEYPKIDAPSRGKFPTRRGQQYGRARFTKNAKYDCADVRLVRDTFDAWTVVVTPVMKAGKFTQRSAGEPVVYHVEGVRFDGVPISIPSGSEFTVTDAEVTVGMCDDVHGEWAWVTA